MMVRAAFTLSMLLLLVVHASGADDGRVPMQPAPSSAPRIVSPPGPVFSIGMPSPQRRPINVAAGHHTGRQGSTAAGWSGYGFGGVPTYQWGYFGANYRPAKVYHRGYYGHQMSYGYRRGY